MIYVTQGHEKGIGLEVFLKSFLLLSPKEKLEVILIADREVLNQNLESLKVSMNSFKNLQVVNPADAIDNLLPSSTRTLVHALNIITKNDILVTLPTSKNQLIHNNKSVSGYTEFFRSYYSNPNISMIFKGIFQNTLLITDHIPLKNVTKIITKKLIIEKINTTLNFYKKYFSTFDEIIFAGINPHVGENGILGKEDLVIQEAIDSLKNFSALKFSGPYSGDTLHMHNNPSKKQLFVYMFHDQGLAQFKAIHGLVGLNISMGLPFLRLSVDHGTAFNLYGSNKANPNGMIFLFKQAFEVNKYVIDQRNQCC